ncbi:MAG TPA: hypothetical protein VMG59_00700 [Phycisphaerae bacterium]|nr:hypothetical protein [Phycisphaerae bacterium]
MPPGTAFLLKHKWLILFLPLAALVLGQMYYNLPDNYDWTFFGFYDTGTVIKGDQLISMGLKPAIDFGYTHGLATLLVSHWGFEILGRTPNAVLIMMAIFEVLMALAIARLVMALKPDARAIVFLFCAIPIAVMPCYLTLTHPLEAFLILWALAEHARGRRAQALAICTTAIFFKPSMGYVYGFFLTILILRDAFGQAKPLRTLIGNFWLPALVGILMALALVLRFGLASLALTILPITGARTYAQSNFNFFTGSGKDFWFPTAGSGANSLYMFPALPFGPHDLNYYLSYYLFTPAGIWLLLSVIVLVAGIVLAWKLRKRSVDPRIEVLVCIAAMHVIFVLCFYGWTRSWQYYSYLPVLFVVGLMCLAKPNFFNWTWAMVLCLAALVSFEQEFQVSSAAWKYKTQLPETGGLWVWDGPKQEWQYILSRIDDHPTLIMSNGYLPWMPRNMVMPLSWFTETGIATKSEIARVKQQAQKVEYVIEWNQYAQLDLWNQPDFAAVKGQFRNVWQGWSFTLWRRRGMY